MTTTNTSDMPYYQKSETKGERVHHEAFALRNFHNNVKRHLYRAAAAVTVSGSTVLDLGAGRGGDISKYRDINAACIVGLDKDEAGLVEFKSRLRPCDNVTLVRADMTTNLQQPLISWCNKPSFDIVSCQFAMHYAFRDGNSLANFLGNIDRALNVGGVFIGTILDGQSVSRQLKSCNPSTFRNNGKVFAILETDADISEPSFVGSPIDVTISSISNTARREYLVDFDRLLPYLKAMGLELLYNEHLPSPTGLFSDFFGGQWKLGPEEALYSSMHRYFAFVRVPCANHDRFEHMLTVLEAIA